MYRCRIYKTKAVIKKITKVLFSKSNRTSHRDYFTTLYKSIMFSKTTYIPTRNHFTGKNIFNAPYCHRNKSHYVLRIVYKKCGSKCSLCNDSHLT